MEKEKLLSFGGHVGKITNDGGYYGYNNSDNSGLKQKRVPRPPLVGWIQLEVAPPHRSRVETLTFGNRAMSVDFDRVLVKKYPACLISFSFGGLFGVIT